MLRSRLLLTPFTIALLTPTAFGQPNTVPSGQADEVTHPTDATKLRIYVGTYTSPQTGSKGIYLFELDTQTEALEARGLVSEVASPSFLAVHPHRRFLYAVGEIMEFQGKKAGAVSAFLINHDTGKLTLLNQQPSGGQGPCHVTVEPGGKCVLVANYTSGTVAALPIDNNGRLEAPKSVIQHQGSGPNTRRQASPHAHSINVDPAGRFALAPDLGADKVFIYRFDASAGTLVANDPPAAKPAPGSGPRHFAFHPAGRFAYVINELASTVTAFTYDAAHGALSEIQTISTLPAGFSEPSFTADIHVHPSGKFLYGSNRGHDSLAIFSIDRETGRLTPIGHQSTRGKWPRNFAIDPSGRWLLAANQNSNSLVLFRIDPQTGLLTPTGTIAEVPSPSCVQFVQPDPPPRGGSLGDLPRRWQLITDKAAFAPRDGAGALVFKDRMWLLGGWNPGDKAHFPNKCNSEVWSSSDGLTWKLENPKAPWEARHTAGYVVHNARMWIVGGDPLQGHYQNDVWSSTDGVDWKQVVNEVPWAPRALHYTVAFNNRIWVMGGQTLPQFAPAPEAFYNDVWSTKDGKTWNRATEHAPWAPRGMIGGSVVFRDRIWILGGGTYDTPASPRRFYNDVWSTADGIHWEQHAEKTAWAPRQYHDVAVFDNRMWVLEGWNQSNRNDVWYSSDGVDWHELPATPWPPRHAASVFVFQNALWLVAGNNMTSDVWKLSPGK